MVAQRVLTVNKAIYYSYVAMWDCHTRSENAQAEVIKGWMLRLHLGQHSIKSYLQRLVHALRITCHFLIFCRMWLASFILQ